MDHEMLPFILIQYCFGDRNVTMTPSNCNLNTSTMTIYLYIYNSEFQLYWAFLLHYSFNVKSNLV